MTAKKCKARKPPEDPPPSDWIRSRLAKVPAKVVRTTTDSNGRWLYRLRYSGGIFGNQLWTLDELQGLEPQWLKRQPSDWTD